MDFTTRRLENRRSAYPLAALQQLTRNAVMHRTYEGTAAPVRVYWFDDRIEITISGATYGNLVKAAQMVRGHLQGIVTAVCANVTNARAESVNAKIQWIKRMARGYRNMQRFMDAILFHLGKLD